MNKQFLCVAAATLFSLGAIAETYYVDRSRPDDSGDGKTEATAKRTIQAAIDINDATDVIVLPGVYDEGRRPRVPMGLFRRASRSRRRSR